VSYTVRPSLGSRPHTQGNFGNIAIIAKAGLILQDYSIPRQALVAEQTTRANPRGIDPGHPVQSPKRLGGLTKANSLCQVLDSQSIAGTQSTCPIVVGRNDCAESANGEDVLDRTCHRTHRKLALFSLEVFG